MVRLLSQHFAVIKVFFYAAHFPGKYEKERGNCMDFLISGILAITWKQVIMYLVGLVLI